MKTSVYKRKIYYHDTDCGDVVYYANYLKFSEEARDEYFADCGLNLRQLNNDGRWFVVGNVDVKFVAPARFNDELNVTTKIESIKSASIMFYQEILCAKQVLCVLKTKIVSVGSDFKPQKIPEQVNVCFKK